MNALLVCWQIISFCAAGISTFNNYWKLVSIGANKKHFRDSFRFIVTYDIRANNVPHPHIVLIYGVLLLWTWILFFQFMEWHFYMTFLQQLLTANPYITTQYGDTTHNQWFHCFAELWVRRKLSSVNLNSWFDSILSGFFYILLVISSIMSYFLIPWLSTSNIPFLWIYI